MAKQAFIIGAGHNGLVCSCYLAKKGIDVTLLERRHIVGGAAVTEEFHPGFSNSTASYTVSLLHPSIIDDLNLKAHGLRFVHRPVNNFLPMPSGEFLSLSADSRYNQTQLAKFSKQDAHNLTRYNQDLGEIVPIVKDLMIRTPVQLANAGMADIWRAISLASAFKNLSAKHKQLMMKLFSQSAAEILEEYFESDAIKAILGFDAIVGHFDSPYSPGSAYVLLHHLLGEVDGKQGAWGHAIGGMGAITQAMASEARALGVKIITEQAVSNIELIDGNIKAIHTSGSQSFAVNPDDVVVANVNPKLLFQQLIEKQHIPDDISHHFSHFKCQSGTFRMNIALDSLPAFTAADSPELLQAGIIMAPNLAYMDRAYQDAKQFGWSKAPIVEMLIPSIVDHSLAPEGQHVASLFCQQFDPGLGELWDEKRTLAADQVIKTVEEFAPGISKKIIARQIHSPLDLERKFGLVGGDIFHGRLSLEQLYAMRPMIGMGAYQTHIPKLFMCGAGTHPGGGVSGLPGYNAAREILRRI